MQFDRNQFGKSNSVITNFKKPGFLYNLGLILFFKLVDKPIEISLIFPSSYLT